MKKKIVDKMCLILSAIRWLPLYWMLMGLLRRTGRGLICGHCDMLRFSRGLVREEQIRKYKKVMVFQKALYDYEYFNICFLNNILALCLKAVCDGCIPRIEIINSKGENVWEMMFRQPFEDIPTAGLRREIIQQPDYLEVFPSFQDVYDKDSIRQWGAIYAFFARFNEKAQSYIDEELAMILGGRRVLGVLCRGTDYVETKPKGHPMQPEIGEIIAKTQELFHRGEYQFVYLATEDGRYDRAFRAAFGEKLLTNKRSYYDELYLKNDISLIKDVHFDRGNDSYLKGIEYVSSLQILSRCQGLVAGNCGGTQAAVFWNRGQYRELFVFDLGQYQ